MILPKPGYKLNIVKDVYGKILKTKIGKSFNFF